MATNRRPNVGQGRRGQSTGLGLRSGGPYAAAVPGGQGACQVTRPRDGHRARAQQVRPFARPQVPRCQGSGLPDDHEIHLDPWVSQAYLGLHSVEDHPHLALLGGLVRELEADYHPMRGQAVDHEVLLAPVMQKKTRVAVLGVELEPLLRPGAHRHQHWAQCQPGWGRAIDVTPALRMRPDRDDASPF